MSRRLATTIPGIGPIGATLLSIKVVDARGFKSARNFAAWLGLTPKNHSTAGKNRLGVITRAGDEMLRSVLVAGATAVIGDLRRGGSRIWPWLKALIARKPPKLVAIALANKIDGADRLEIDDQRRTLPPHWQRRADGDADIGMNEMQSLASGRQV
jgi:transposase